jgi:hypothetical protein
MKVILKEGDEAKDFFEELVNRVADSVVVKFEKRLKELGGSSEKSNEHWVSTSEAKQLLGIKSNKKMQSLRDQNLIKFSQHGRIVRYHKPSLYEFLEKNVVK